MKKTHPLWHPAYWPAWLVIGVMRLLSFLPHRVLMHLGTALGWVLYKGFRSRRKIASMNLKICFPELTVAERRQLLKASFKSLGQGMLEMSMAWWWPDKKLAPIVKFVGEEHLEAARAFNKPILALSAHFSSMELAGRLVALKYNFGVTYRKISHPVFNRFVIEKRNKIYQYAVWRKNVREMMRVIKSNVPMWLAVDHDFGRKHSVFVPFFGKMAAFIATPTRFAQAVDAVALPVYYYRTADAKGYEVHFKPVIENFAAHTPEDNARLTSESIEAAIRHAPEQYLWIHRRYKTQHDSLEKWRYNTDR